MELAIIQALGLDPNSVVAGSVNIAIQGEGVVIRYGGVKVISHEDFGRVMAGVVTPAVAEEKVTKKR